MSADQQEEKKESKAAKLTTPAFKPSRDEINLGGEDYPKDREVVEQRCKQNSKGSRMASSTHSRTSKLNESGKSEIVRRKLDETDPRNQHESKTNLSFHSRTSNQSLAGVKQDPLLNYQSVLIDCSVKALKKSIRTLEEAYSMLPSSVAVEKIKVSHLHKFL